MKNRQTYYRILNLLCLLCFAFFYKNAHSQTVTAQLVGHGLTDTFTYQNKSMPHYSIYWTTDTWYSSGGAVWISSYGGVKFFSAGQYRMGINHAGNVGIGTESPQTALAVNGTVTAKEVNVTTAGWPDYVFKPGYRLPLLTEVSEQIVKQGHLPGMPSAGDIEKNGLGLGAMSKLQQQKIEELTLYLIEQNKLITNLEKRIDILEKKLSVKNN